MVTPNPPLRIIFFGTPEFAVPTLNALLASRHVVTAVVTQPDRPKGRGQHLYPSPVKTAALAAGVPVLQPERLRDESFLQALAALQPDLGVVAAYGKILTDNVLRAPRMGLVNVHASLLPKYRGAAPVHRAIMAGESLTGITIMRLVRELDAGPMLMAVSRPIDPRETSVEVERNLALIGADALQRAVDKLAAGLVPEVPQDASAATYAPKLEKSDGIVDWSRQARTIHNQIRGLHPWPHAYSDLQGQRCLLLESAVEPYAPTDATPGVILEAEKDRLYVQTGDGALRILRLQMEGRKPLAARDFLAGHHIEAGTMFVSPVRA
jgi:methionyl-tRNA formyltransferase